MSHPNHSNKVIITCAVTGVAALRGQCPAIPYTVEETAQACHDAFNAGASIAHIHAREDDGTPAFRAERYREIRDAVASRCPILINFSTGAVGIPMEERVAHMALKPEIGALNMGSMNYAKYSPKTKQFYFDMIFANPFADIALLLEHMNTHGVHPELECFDVGHIHNATPLIDMGLLRPPFHFSLILGVLGGIPPTTQNLAHMAAQLPGDARWEVIGISHLQWRLVAAALSLGGNVRVGLEDNFYLSDGVMASGNGALVDKAARMARDQGFEPATPGEAREILGIGTRAF